MKKNSNQNFSNRLEKIAGRVIKSLICVFTLCACILISSPMDAHAENNIPDDNKAVRESNYGEHILHIDMNRPNTNDTEGSWWEWTIPCPDSSKFYAVCLSGNHYSGGLEQYRLYAYTIDSYSRPVQVQRNNPSYNRYSSKTGQTSHDTWDTLEHTINPSTEHASGTIPFFSSVDDFYNFCILGTLEGLLDGFDYQGGDIFDTENAVFNNDIPAPQLVFKGDGGYKFYINNAVDDYYIEIQGRWYTVDDIELYKQNLMWKYKYSTEIKGDLTHWIPPNDAIESKGEHDLSDYGESAFQSLLNQFPVEMRNYYGGTNAIGNYFSGYNDALTMLQEVFLPECTSSYNSAEIYIRFWTLDDGGNANYGRWCHWFSNIADSSGSSGSTLDDLEIYGENQSQQGLTDSDKNNLELSGNPKKEDTDIKPTINSKYLETSDNVWNTIQSMTDSAGALPLIMADIFSFLPHWVLSLVAAGIAAIVILRFLGR